MNSFETHGKPRFHWRCVKAVVVIAGGILSVGRNFIIKEYYLLIHVLRISRYGLGSPYAI